MPVNEQTQQEDRYAATSWGTSGEDLRMPSGQLAHVRKPGVQGLINAGVLHSLDSLSGIVDGIVKKAEGKKVSADDVDTKALLEDPAKLESMIHVIDRVVCHVVLKPTVHMTPNDRTRRKDNLIYADMIDFEDKMFIFNFAVGGSRDIARFREESSLPVGGMADVTSHEHSTEPSYLPAGRAHGVEL